MIQPRMLPLVFKYIVRHQARSLLTLGGIASAMFLFCAVQAMRSGVAEATEETAGETTLVVYRENRFCPFTSELPEDYGRKIAAIHGVAEVSPMRIVVNNCRAALDVVTYRGITETTLRRMDVSLLDGSIEEWTRHNDAAVVGVRLTPNDCYGLASAGGFCSGQCQGQAQGASGIQGRSLRPRLLVFPACAPKP